MMKFSIITLFPDMLSALTQEGVVARAVKRGLLDIEPIQLRDYATNSRKNVDGRPAGGGDGMVIRADVTQKAIHAHAQPSSYIVHLSPSGQPFTHTIAKDLAQKKHVILLCGRYSGFDARVVNKYAHIHLSIGDYVLSGGELPAMCVIDATARFIPGVLGNEESALNDSFEHGLLEAPVYTKPFEFEGETIPEVLMSGNHRKIKEYQYKEQLRMTKKFRPDLYREIESMKT